MEWSEVIRLIAGVVLLAGGAELLVRGASRLALSLGLSPLVVGLTVVGYGTSAPEVAVSLSSALKGSTDMAMGNVVGSNIVNILLILGASALMAPLVISKRLVRVDVPLMIGVGVLAFVMARDGSVSRIDGLLLFAGAITYTVVAIATGRNKSDEATGDPTPPRRRSAIVIDLSAIVLGIALLVYGANLLVGSATVIARSFGVSDLVIGLTVVAVGTSLPELATSLMAAFRGEREIAAGNVIGSNLFNILLVLGGTAAVAPQGVSVAPAMIAFDLPVMLAVSVACLPIFLRGHVIARWEGGLFLFYFAMYFVYLGLASANHDALPKFSFAMMFFVIPLTVATLAVIIVRQLRQTAAVPAPETT
ncbi:MAG: calcium/sodium antiporter [Acidobacteria bacterium]|nr:calcium/sodium antiporter [Acidobacteriota bacterium]